MAEENEPSEKIKIIKEKINNKKQMREEKKAEEKITNQHPSDLEKEQEENEEEEEIEFTMPEKVEPIQDKKFDEDESNEKQIEEPKKRRGRPKGSKNKSKENDPIEKEVKKSEDDNGQYESNEVTSKVQKQYQTEFDNPFEDPESMMGSYQMQIGGTYSSIKKSLGLSGFYFGAGNPKIARVCMFKEGMTSQDVSKWIHFLKQYKVDGKTPALEMMNLIVIDEGTEEKIIDTREGKIDEED